MTTTTSSNTSIVIVVGTLSLCTGLLLGACSGALIGVVWVQRKQKKRRGPETATTRTPESKDVAPTSLPDHVRAEQLSRHTLYFGESNMHRLANSKVCVVGCGGVGSHTAISLARSGLKQLRLIDFDQVTLSSLNRHACATLSDVGISKVTCLQAYCHKLCPDPRFLQVEAFVEMLTAESAPRLLDAGDNGPFDVIVDAIDDVPTKAALIHYAITVLKVPVISCMGAGGKVDPTRLHISDLATASRDPLATKLKTTLKQLARNDESRPSYFDNANLLSILYSSEKTVMKLADFATDSTTPADQLGAVDGMRVRVLPVVGTLPATFGQALAAHVLCNVLCKTTLSRTNKAFAPVPGERVGKNVRNKLFQHFKTREDQITKLVQSRTEDGDSLDIESGCTVNGIWIGDLQVDQDEMDSVFEVWKNRCAISGARLGTVLKLYRWDLSKPSNFGNVILVSSHVMEQLDTNTLNTDKVHKGQSRNKHPVDEQNRPQSKTKSSSEKQEAFAQLSGILKGGKDNPLIPSDVRQRIEEQLRICQQTWF